MYLTDISKIYHLSVFKLWQLYAEDVLFNRIYFNLSKALEPYVVRQGT